mmetsp:Transcript_4791/g.10117  ORF Transcript_4791/g.10117 Transcript_4791/m.10117 type:complete len:284 (-) Transcript_4791:276-1127(-)
MREVQHRRVMRDPSVRPIEKPEARNGLRITITRAKLNHKYKRRKKQKPRLNDDDTSAIAHMLQRTKVHFGYDVVTGNLWFDTPIKGDDIEFDGLDTGGQVIRWWLQWSIVRSGGRDGPPESLRVYSNGKACMLYVQASMFTLEEGESFVVQGGNPANSDAPTPRFYAKFFDELRALLGVSFRLEDLSTSNCPKFELSRSKNVTPDSNWNQGTVPLPVHTTDQLLMAIGFVRPDRQIVLRCEEKEDYHVDAMLRVLKVMGHKIDCVVHNNERVITIEQIAENSV